MRFLIPNTDYPELLTWLYVQRPGLESRPYAEQMQVRAESLFGVADFYSSKLCKLGHEAYDIHVNNRFLQHAWAHQMTSHPKTTEAVNQFLTDYRRWGEPQ